MTFLPPVRSFSPVNRGLAEASLDGEAQWFERGATIAQPDTPPRVRLLVSGWAAHVRDLPDGRRQIVRLLIPGDLCGALRPEAGHNTCTVVALTRARVADMGNIVRALDPENPAHARLGALIAVATAGEAEALVTQVVRLGRMSAYERTAHLLLELFDRLSAAGLAQGRRMPFPLTQDNLADALGLSIVHVNRTLQQLRREGLIEYRASAVTLLDRDQLAEICGYELKPAARGGEAGNRAPAPPALRPSSSRSALI